MRILTLAALSLTAFAAPALAQVEPMPRIAPGEAAQLAELDAALFAAAFEDCDAAAVRAIVADDFEFYHDRGGMVADNGDDFAAGIAENCTAIAAGEQMSARRELIAGTMEVQPLGSYGAVQTGRHNFYEVRGEDNEVLRETALFLHVWQRTDNGWRLARVVSYAHEPAE